MKYEFELKQINIDRLLKELDESMRDKVVAIQSIDKIYVHTNVALNPEDIQALQTKVENHEGSPTPLLRVHRVMPLDSDPLITDFTILGFRKESPSYDRGRKTQSRYLCLSTTEEIVVKTFSDVRDVQGTLSGLQVEFKYYDESGAVALTKTEIVKNYNKYEAQTEERKRRERQLDYMIASGKNTPIEPYIDIIFGHYAIQEQQYRTHGSSHLADAIKNETDQNILGILGIMTIPVEANHPDWPNGCTVGQGIIYQITGEKP